MTWERRLRDMILAGGVTTLTAAACGSSSGSSSPGPCCNINPDPCCLHDYCGAPMTPACAAERACAIDGGTAQPNGSGGFVCSPHGGSPGPPGPILYADAQVSAPPEAGVDEAAASDAADGDAPGVDGASIADDGAAGDAAPLPDDAAFADGDAAQD
jgi:hypothetical protein